MKVKPLLPPLDDHNWQAPAQPGRWHAERDTDFIRKLAGSLVIAGAPDAALDQISIPDIWAPLKLFEIALFDDKSPLHRRALGEWRGLIALYALSEFRGLSLRTATLALPNHHGNLAEDRKTFLDVAVDLRPDVVLFRGQNWNTIGQLLYRDRTVAFVVPSVLLCPVRGYEAYLDAAVQWRHRDDGRLDDPNACPLRGEEFAVIERYCRDLLAKARTWRAEAVNLDRLNRLIGLLDDYHQALQTNVPLEAPLCKPVPRPIHLPEHRFYGDAFQQVFRLEERIQFGGGLKVREPFQDLIRGGLLIDPQLATWLAQPAADVLLWEYYTLERLNQEPALAARITQDAADHGYLTLTADDLFTRHLCRVKPDQEIIGHHGPGRRFILPLRPIMLLFLSPREINEALTIRVEGGKATVGLQLSVYDHQGQTRLIVISKVYDTIHEKINPPTVLSLWPNFNSETWHYYYVLTTLNPQEQIMPRGIFSRTGIYNTLANAQCSLDRVASARNLAEHQIGVTNVYEFSSQPNAYSALFYLRDMPEAIYCQAIIPETNQKSKEELGLLLMPVWDEPALTQERWHVGVDFGTTNTAIYYHSTLQNPIQPMTFANRIVSLFSGLERTEAAQLDYEVKFLPLQNIPTPFLTVLEEREQQGQQHATRQPLWTDRISYVPDVDTAIGRLESKSWRFNLKWSQDPNGRERIHMFLSQVILQTLAEAQARGIRPDHITWSFSYPEEAFGSQQAENFETICHFALETALDPQIVHGNGMNTIRRFSPESECTALYFYAKGKAIFTESVLTIDIGGGTTDISLWQNQQLIWRTSLRLAGQDILIKYLNRNTSLLQELRERALGGINADTLQKIINFDESSGTRGQAIEILVNSPWYQQAIRQHLPFSSQAEQSELRGLLRITELALAGILYYVGRVINYLGNVECLANGQPRFNLQRDNLHICVGGKGSLLIEELINEDDRNKLVRMFQEVAGLGKEPQVYDLNGKLQSMYLSQEPKCEVAHGLLVYDQRSAAANLNMDNPWLDTLLGESLLLSEHSMTSEAISLSKAEPNQSTQLEEALTPSSHLPHQYRWRVENLTELHNMIQRYEKGLGRQVFFDSGCENLLKSKINQELEIMRSEVENARARRPANANRIVHEMQPIFIVALRALIEQLIQRQSTPQGDVIR